MSRSTVGISLAAMLILFGLFNLRIANALWQSPSQAFPGATIAPPLTSGTNPQTRTGPLTVTGELSGQNNSSLLPQTGTPMRRGGVVSAGGRALNGTAFAAGLYGLANGSAGAGVEAGVYGRANTNESSSVGVFADTGSANGGSNFLLSFAGFFNGAVDVNGPLVVQGKSGTCSNNQAVCKYRADCGTSYANTCTGATFATYSTGSTVIVQGNPAPVSQQGTVTANAFYTNPSGTDYYGVVSAIDFAEDSPDIGRPGVAGYIPTAVTCGVDKFCAGIYGSDGQTEYLQPGRWAAYFSGAVNFGQMLFNTAATGINTNEYEPLKIDPPQMVGTPDGALLGSLRNATTPWGIAYDGSAIWATRWGDIRAIAKIDPVTLVPLANCTISVGGLTATAITYDGRYLWYIGTTSLVRLDPQTVTGFGAACGGTALAGAPIPSNVAAPVMGARLVGSTERSLWYAGRLTAPPASIGNYLVEVDPQTMAVLSSTKVSSNVSLNISVADDGTNLWMVGVAVSQLVVRVPKANKAGFTTFDYNATSCPATYPNCLTGDVNTYRGVVAGAGSVWITGTEASGTQRTLRIDPASSPTAGIGPVQNAYAVGAGLPMAYDGQYVWTMNQESTNQEIKLYAIRTFDHRIFTFPMRFTGSTLTPRSMLFDGTNIWATENTTQQLLKVLK